MRLHDEPPARHPHPACWRRRPSATDGNSHTVDDLEFHAPGGPVDRNPVPLPGAVGVERVGQSGPARVVDRNRKVVLDRDAGREDVTVAQVAVVLLGVEIQTLQTQIRE